MSRDDEHSSGAFHFSFERVSRSHQSKASLEASLTPTKPPSICLKELGDVLNELVGLHSDPQSWGVHQGQEYSFELSFWYILK